MVGPRVPNGRAESEADQLSASHSSPHRTLMKERETADAKSLQSCPTPSLGFSRQEHWSGLPFPSPTHKSEK